MQNKRKKVSVLVVKDLNQYIESIIMDFEKLQKLQFECIYQYLWLRFSGDNGWKVMKFHFEVIKMLALFIIFISMLSNHPKSPKGQGSHTRRLVRDKCRNIKKMEACYNKNFIKDRAGCDLHKTGIAIFPLT